MRETGETVTSQGGKPVKECNDDDLRQDPEGRFSQSKRALEELSLLTEKLERLNRKLKESEEMKSTFISNIRNEMGSPLYSIMGLARRLAAHSDDPEKVQRTAALIYEEAFDFHFQLRNVFAAAELEAGEVRREVAKVDIRVLLDDVLASLEHKVREKNLDVGITGPVKPGSGEALFMGDGGKLELVMTNLLSNAVKFSLPGGSIDVTLGNEDGLLTIEVKDVGVGIDSTCRETIFDRFSRRDASTKRSFRGQGLGLSVTKALVELMVGSITYRKNAPEGSVFEVRIPEASRLSTARMVAMGGNMFIFDDDAMEQEL
jgi:signal transduction histidine kinase